MHALKAMASRGRPALAMLCISWKASRLRPAFSHAVMASVVCCATPRKNLCKAQDSVCEASGSAEACDIGPECTWQDDECASTAAGCMSCLLLSPASFGHPRKQCQGTLPLGTSCACSKSCIVIDHVLGCPSHAAHIWRSRCIRPCKPTSFCVNPQLSTSVEDAQCLFPPSRIGPSMA